MEELPKLTDSIYKEIEEFEDYEYSNCIAYEMCIRNKEVKRLISIAIDKLDEILEVTEHEFIMHKESIEIECNELKKYGAGGSVLSSILMNKYYEINNIKTGKGGLNIVYENEAILNRDKEYAYITGCEDGLIAQIDEIEDNFEIIPYERINLDYIPLIEKDYSRPTLELIKNKIFKINLNLNLPKNELLDYVSTIIDEYEKGHSSWIMSPLELIGLDRSKGNRMNINKNKINKNKINKNLIAKKFFVYDYVTKRLEQIEENNQCYIDEYEYELNLINNNQYISPKHRDIQIKEIKKELHQNTKTNIMDIFTDLEEFENIEKETARRYYYNIKPYIDDLKYKELITGILQEDDELKKIHEDFFELIY